MSSSPRSTVAIFLGLILVGLVSVIGTARAETYVGRLIAEDLFDKLKFAGRVAIWPVDAAQARQAGLSPASAAALSDKIRVAIHQIGTAKGLAFVEREAISKIFQEQQFSHGATDSDFEKLARQADADALVLISIQRQDSAEIVVSARLVRSKGNAVGQILAASKSYEVTMAQDSAAQTAGDPVVPRTVIRNDPTVPQSAPTPAYNPGTITPNAVPSQWAGGTVSSYAPSYAVASAAPYTYYAAPSYYYARPYYARPQVRVAYGGYRRWR